MNSMPMERLPKQLLLNRKISNRIASTSMRVTELMNDALFQPDCILPS